MREKTDQELTKLLAEKRQALVDCRLQKATLKLKNNQKISQAKREVARILTLLREKEIEDSLKGGLKK